MLAKTKKQLITNEILRLVTKGHDLLEISIVDNTTGELLEEGLYVDKFLIKECWRKDNCLVPFIKLSANPIIDRDYFSKLGDADFRRVINLMRKIDAFGRIKYGDNIQQYCRNIDDLNTILNMSEKNFYKFKKTLKDTDLIRVVSIDKNQLGIQQYITFNPAVVMNGKFFDRFTIITWGDVIEKYGLLTKQQISKIMKGESIFLGTVDINTKGEGDNNV